MTLTWPCYASKVGVFLAIPMSLTSHLFKAKYFPHCDFLYAKLGANPSFVWRSIWASQILIKEGAYKRVGNDSTISMLQDPWLPNLDNPRIESHHHALENQMVSYLIQSGSLKWDPDIIYDLFNQRDATLILSIPLSTINIQDCWFWMFES